MKGTSAFDTVQRWRFSFGLNGKKSENQAIERLVREAITMFAPLSLFFINALILALSWWLKKVDAKTYLCLWTWTLLFSFTYRSVAASFLRYFGTASSIFFIVTLCSLGWPGVHMILLTIYLCFRQLIPPFISSTKQNRVKTIKYK